MQTLLLNRLIHGYDEIEPVILGLMALDKSFILIGRHGTGKTKLARLLSRGYNGGSFVFYDATKDDLISIAGIPDPESIKVGKLRFIGHERSIWDKSVIVVDEITRAAKENQNLWLEILEEHTCFGIPLNYQTIIATANPESYAAAFQLDEALLDRFYAVIPVPEMQTGIDYLDVEKMVKLSFANGGDVASKEIIEIFNEIRKAHDFMLSDNAQEKVSSYLGKVIPSILGMIMEQNNLYLSPRTYCHLLPESILAIAAYYKVAGSHEPLIDAAIHSLRYCVATKIQINPLAIEQFHHAASIILKGGALFKKDKLRIELSAIKEFDDVINYFTNNWQSINMEMSGDEIEKSIKSVFNDVKNTNNYYHLLKFQSVLVAVGYGGDTLRQIKGQLRSLLFTARRKILPILNQLLLPAEKDSVLTVNHHEVLVKLQQILENAQFISDFEIPFLKVKGKLIEISEKYKKLTKENLAVEIEEFVNLLSKDNELDSK